MRYNNIFWDFNGTVVDDVNAALGCVNDMLTRKNKNHITLDEYYTFVDTPIIKFYEHILTPEELDFAQISEDFHCDYAKKIGEINLADGAFELLHDLKTNGVHQYIVTATHEDEAVSLLHHYGVFDCFDAVLGAQDKRAESKIDRAKSLFTTLGIDRSDALFVGDTLHDLETANALGIDCVLVTYGHHGEKILSQSGARVVRTIADVKEIIYGK